MGCCEGTPGQGPPALSPQPRTAPAGEGFDAIDIKNGAEKKTPTNSRKKVLGGITQKKSEAQKHKSPLASFLGKENGFPEQYHSFDMPVLVSQLPENSLGKKSETFQEALLAACHQRCHQKGRPSP